SPETGQQPGITRAPCGTRVARRQHVMRLTSPRNLAATLLVLFGLASLAQAQPAAQAPAAQAAPAAPAEPAAQVKPAQTAQPARPGLRRTAGPGIRAFKSMRSLNSAARHDPYTKPIMDRVRDDRARTIDSKGGSASRIAERAAWVPLGADPELRRATVATV